MNWQPAQLTGIESIDNYNRSGALLDAHLGGKMDADECRLWTMELKARDVLNYLDGGKLIFLGGVYRCLMEEEYQRAVVIKSFWESAGNLN